jgi:hypothetical protein
MIAPGVVKKLIAVAAGASAGSEIRIAMATQVKARQ